MNPRKLTIAMLWLLIPWTVMACGMGDTTAEGYENTDIKHAHSHWKQGKKSPIPFQFIDVRTAKEYSEGHVPGAINIPVQVIAEHLNEVPKDKQVYVYCESGVRSTKAASLLAKSGFKNIENMHDGMRGWRNHDYPQEK
ncbi:MAG: rhodanese-like domain-containing protein [Mariprofundaceae bacterium]|nr:rhodanese-like domain-containing protein [Mariprofundaceae bacterium]